MHMTNSNTSPPLRDKFWRDVPMDQLTRPEWEALCDGCGKCCLLKLEDEDTGRLEYTSVVCKLFDDKTCGCTKYTERQKLVPTCVVLTPDNIAEIAYWMPSTCAYRLLWSGKQLPAWHPLETGDPDSVHSAGISMRDKVISELDVRDEDLEDYIEEGLQ